MKDSIVCKFGGSSLADSNQFRKVKKIIEMDDRRKFVVPSAPGKRNPDDTKITDLLYLCSTTAEQKMSFDSILNIIKNRYVEIARDLKIYIDLDYEFDLIRENLIHGASAAYAASRGEYLSGKLLSKYLGYEFVDPVDLIVISRTTGSTRWEETKDKIARRLKSVEKAVIPGFYGTNIKGEIATYSRGGSDVTGAVIARGIGAVLYENWTDVDGFKMVDPRILQESHKIEYITYNELRELAYMGASVLHEETMIPCMKADIPINIRNTNAPEEKGTMILDKSKMPDSNMLITGISGKKGFVAICIEKILMNQERGVIATILSIFERYGIAIDHLPTGIDNLTIVVSKEQIDTKLQRVVRDLQVQLNADQITVHTDMAVIAVVGHNMAYKPGISARIFKALGENGINVKLISQGILEISILIGIAEEDLERGVEAIYREFK